MNRHVNPNHNFFVECHKIGNSYDNEMNNLFKSIASSNAKVVFYGISKMVYEAPASIMVNVPEVPDNSKRGIAKQLLIGRKRIVTDRECIFKCHIFEKVKSIKQAVYVDDVLFFTHLGSMNFSRGDSCEFTYSFHIKR